jgi:hypothetical protein
MIVGKMDTKNFSKKGEIEKHYEIVEKYAII